MMTGKSPGFSTFTSTFFSAQPMQNPTTIAQRIAESRLPVSPEPKRITYELLGVCFPAPRCRGRKGTSPSHQAYLSGDRGILQAASWDRSRTTPCQALQPGLHTPYPDPARYRWCGYAAAVAGDRNARRGISRAVRHEHVKRVYWAKTAAVYRLLLYGTGGERLGGETVDGKEKRKGGFSQREIEEVWRTGGRIPLEAALRCRVRYFTDGLVLGGSEFVDRFFERQRGCFSRQRESGARKMKGAE